MSRGYHVFRWLIGIAGLGCCAANGARCDISVNGVTVCRGVELCRAASLITNVFLGVHALMPGINEVELQVAGCAEGLDAVNLSVGLDGVDIGSFYALNQERRMVSPLAGANQAVNVAGDLVKYQPFNE